MKLCFDVGAQKTYRRKVVKEDFAAFHGEIVHSVCSTFALARDAEWTTRQFVLDMREPNEEGIGTFVNIEHCSPAFEGEELVFTGTIIRIQGHEVICDVEVRAGDRLVAKARTGQKILKREKLTRLFQHHE